MTTLGCIGTVRFIGSTAGGIGIHCITMSTKSGWESFQRLRRESLEIVMVGILCIMGNFGAAVLVRSLVIMGNLGGHLHLVETYRFGPTNQVDVYEMARDYSMWSVKYRVDDLDGVGIVRCPPGCSSISVLCVVRTERDEESFMVLHVPGKILGYGFADGNFKEICGVAAPEGFDNEGGVQDVLTYFWSDCYPYVESLSRV